MKEVNRDLFVKSGRKGGLTTADRHPDQFKEMQKKSVESRKLRVKSLSKTNQVKINVHRRTKKKNTISNQESS